jgi:D-alanine-D-alanine ligase-like ATP-grasp enzyme
MGFATRTFYGPNLYTPYAAVAADFELPFTQRVLASFIDALWKSYGNPSLSSQGLAMQDLDFVDLMVHIAINLQHPDAPDKAKIYVNRHAAQVSVFLGFLYAPATKLVLKSAFNLTERLFQIATNTALPQKPVTPSLNLLKIQLDQWLPQRPIIRTLIDQAHQRSIPVAPVAPNSHIWMLGHGANAKHYSEAANEKDSFTGMKLQRDKTFSNAWVKKLGFPGVQHALARDFEQARSIAHRLNYPVVVKPVASGKGNGVSAFVVDDDDLALAFNKAASASQTGVIIERHVIGNDHRIAVFGGKVAWVVARYPASVQGDGVSSIAQLIEIENQRRQHDPISKELGLISILVEPEMVRHLKKQGLTLDSQPPRNHTVKLRSIANISKGGSLADVTDVTHPDNIEMAESLARCFRMDTLGVDFMTPDISRSWREMSCAVIEVNGMPGILFDDRAARILEATFSGRSNGRIPSVILIDAPQNISEDIVQWLSDRHLLVGWVSAKTTQLNGRQRCQANDPIHRRVGSLLADPNCEAIVVESNAHQIQTIGLPLDQFDLALVFSKVSDDLRALLRRHTTQYIDSPIETQHLEVIMKEIIDKY